MTVTSERTPAPTSDTSIVYTVEPGDTAWALATEFGITLAQLAAANDMTEAELELLQIGQELRIPR